ncbi:hypothetical protein K0M31_020409 [Melipona bicolor]|uniref:Uncharacterized protein n=1 Tax=Melipona bicolor TaxID=60889 RepID=A0AA40KQQ8_9HYME|nr:hypothetical protein K0M31_020409 [Melipona bicolor]
MREWYSRIGNRRKEGRKEERKEGRKEGRKKKRRMQCEDSQRRGERRNKALMDLEKKARVNDSEERARKMTMYYCASVRIKCREILHLRIDRSIHDKIYK